MILQLMFKLTFSFWNLIDLVLFLPESEQNWKFVILIFFPEDQISLVRYNADVFCRICKKNLFEKWMVCSLFLNKIEIIFCIPEDMYFWLLNEQNKLLSIRNIVVNGLILTNIWLFDQSNLNFIGIGSKVLIGLILRYFFLDCYVWFPSVLKKNGFNFFYIFIYASKAS